MARYIGGRLLFLVPQIIGIVLVGFLLVKAVPGDPATLMLGPMATPESIARLKNELGLEKPLPVQFLIYIDRIAHGDLGKSWQTTQPVMIDGVIDGDWPAVRSAFAHLITPVLTLGLINAGPILKITQSAMEQMLEADFSLYARLCGLSEKLIVRHALRNALPSIVTVVSIIYGFLIGGAVLVETVFSWGGRTICRPGRTQRRPEPGARLRDLLGTVFAGRISDRRPALSCNRSAHS
jgi:ABC-type dipeptide/oligopeptide/nickel transport system permease component